MNLDLEFKGKYVITGRIICETGLHIGGTIEGFEIGGVENIVIHDPLTEWPYIPGSSLKGKLRYLLEWSLGANEFTGQSHHFTEKKKGEGVEYLPCSCGRCEVCVLFGVNPEKGMTEKGDKELGFAGSCEIKQEEGQSVKSTIFAVTGPSRLTVRDAFPTKETLKNWEKTLGEEVYTEVKTENAIDRVTSQANPRTLERVPAGSEFEFEMLFDVYREDDKKLLKSLFTAMHLLEDSALGGSGTRGSGKVKFADIKLTFRPKEYYFNQTPEQLVLKSERVPKPSELKIGEKPKEHSIEIPESSDPAKISYEDSLPKFLLTLIEKI